MQNTTPEIDISVIIPAKDEEKRLPSFLLDVIGFCQASEYRYEIIVVDDGSSDGTSELVEKFQNKFARLHLVTLHRNRGKGHAVRQGFLRASGKVVMFMDADGSTPPAMIEEHYPLFDQGYDVVIGSRVVADGKHRVQARRYRKWIGQIFNFLVHRLLLADVRDTQCGFKMFRAQTVRPLFSRLNIPGFGFDLEVLYLAQKFGYKIKEVPVDWRHVDESKTNLITDSWTMLINILQIRIWHLSRAFAAVPHMSADEIRLMNENEGEHWWFQSKNALVKQKIVSSATDVPQILDAGCGTGLNMQFLSELGNCFGCDAQWDALQFSQSAGAVQLAQCNLEQLCYRPDSFDLITVLDVLEHTAEPERVLAEFKRIVKDNGRIVLTVPAFKFLWSPHDEALSHFRRYHRRELKILLEDAGLRVDELGYHFCLAFVMAAPIRLVKRLNSRGKKLRSDTDEMPPQWLNRLLLGWQGFERKLGSMVPLPFGTTLYAVITNDPLAPQNVTLSFQESCMEPAEERPATLQT